MFLELCGVETFHAASPTLANFLPKFAAGGSVRRKRFNPPPTASETTFMDGKNSIRVPVRILKVGARAYERAKTHRARPRVCGRVRAGVCRRACVRSRVYILVRFTSFTMFNWHSFCSSRARAFRALLFHTRARARVH